MRLADIAAIPHPNGNRIDLTWVNPDPVQFPGVRVMRRADRHPVSSTDGTLVAEGLALNSATDEPLKGETVYYYTLFPYNDNPPVFDTIDLHNRISAMATSPYNFAGQMYDLLPAIYHRYDTILPKHPPPDMLPEDLQKGQLRRFFDLAGTQLDQLYSFVRATLNLHDLNRVDGNLLSLLADWIGWKTDYRREIEQQRNEIRNAPSVYETIGLIPTVEATVKRISNQESRSWESRSWESRSKEFIHNVFVSNRPERLNIWARRRDAAGAWSAPTQPLSLNFAYEGRPTAAFDAAGTYLFSVGPDMVDELNNSQVSQGLRDQFQRHGITLTPKAVVKVEQSGSKWTIVDTDQTYSILNENQTLNVYAGTLWLFYHTLKKRCWNIWYKSSHDGGQTWEPSQPLTNDKEVFKHPTAAVQGATLWVFWAAYNETSQKWCIRFQTQSGGVQSAVQTFIDSTTERRLPVAVADNTGGLWLFWLEKVGAQWWLKYNRHDGTSRQLNAPASFPLDAGADPRVEDDVFVLFHPTSANQPLWVFWTRQDTIAPSQTRHTIAFRIKQSLDPNVSDWTIIRTLPKTAPADYHDREPAAIVDGSGNVEVFWSSNQAGSWSIWRATLNAGSFTWDAAEPITSDPYSQRTPLPLAINGETLLIYRSSESLRYTSKVYGATEMVDFRYAGSATVDTRNVARIALLKKLDDIQAYTYDAGENGARDDHNWYAWDTLGLYVTPPADTTQDQYTSGVARLKQVLREFMPATDRAVLIPDRREEP